MLVHVVCRGSGEMYGCGWGHYDTSEDMWGYVNGSGYGNGTDDADGDGKGYGWTVYGDTTWGSDWEYVRCGRFHHDYIRMSMR